MNITQEHVNALLLWIEDRKSAYLAKGFSLAVDAGIEQLADMQSEQLLNEADKGKSLSDLRSEMLLAEEFYKDARQILYAGRQGG